MKRERVCVASALALSILMAWAWAAPPAPAEIDTVDRQAIAANDYTRFIENIFWPTEDVIAAKRVAKDLVGPDIEELKVLLRRALREEFLPSEQDVAADVIAVEGLRNSADYLLLCYETHQYHIQVQDGNKLSLLVTPKEEGQVPLGKIAEYVRDTTLALLNIPEEDEAGQHPQVTVRSVDIGPSRSGLFTYEAGFPPPKHWYSQIRWWSDGRHILLDTDRRRGAIEDLSMVASPPPGYFDPRLFEYKQAAAEKANP